MVEQSKELEAFLESTGPAAIVLKEHLVPVEGEDGVLFPATFAASEDGRFAGGYNIDEFGNGKNVCLIDSFGAQANRIEPLFATESLKALVPQIVIEAGTRKVNLLDAGHRAGDAIVRCSSLQDELRHAFEALQKGDAEPLARISPTSLVFGVWDSRDTQAKAPRLLASTILAFDVQRLTRSAQFNPAIDYVKEGVLDETEDKKTRDAYAKRGFIHVPASASHGGVIATGGVRREATLHLAALRTLQGTSPEKTAVMQRYLLGLAVTAFTHPSSGYLRQGCNLVLHETKKPEAKVVYPDGRRLDSPLNYAGALAFATEAAKAFGVAESRTVKFDKEKAKKDLQGDDKPKKPAKKGKG